MREPFNEHELDSLTSALCDLGIYRKLPQAVERNLIDVFHSVPMRYRNDAQDLMNIPRLILMMLQALSNGETIKTLQTSPDLQAMFAEIDAAVRRLTTDPQS